MDQETESRVSSLRPHLLPLALIWLVATCYLAPALFMHKVPLPADVLLLESPWKAYSHEFAWFHKAANPVLDVIEEYYPWREFAAHWLRQGQVPLWNPEVFCGTPFVANGQSAIAYPFNWLFALLDKPIAYALFLWLHLGLAGTFAYGLAITQGRSRSAALLTGLIFALSGFFMAWLEYLTFISSGIWLAAALWAYEAARGGRRIWWAGAAGALCLSILGGHLQVAAYVLGAFVLWVVLREIEHPTTTRNWLLAAKLGLGSLGVGLLGALIQVLPSLELGRLSARAGTLSVHQVLANALPLKQAIALVMPFFYGDNYIHASYWGHFNFIETCGYASVVGLVLAGVACLGFRKNKAPGRLGALVLAAVGLAWSFRTGFAVLIYWVIPPFRQLPNVGRAIFLFDFGVAVLAGIGLDALSKVEPRRLKRFLGWVGGVGLGLAVIAWGIWGVSAICAACGLSAGAGIAARAVQKLVLGAELWYVLALGVSVWLIWYAATHVAHQKWASGALVGLALVELAAFGLRLNPQVPVEVLSLNAKIRATLPAEAGNGRFFSFGERLRQLRPNLGMVLGLSDARGYDSLYAGQYEPVLKALKQVQTPEGLEARLPLLRALGVNTLVSEADLRQVAGVVEFKDAQPPFYKVKKALPLTSCTAESERFNSSAAAVQDLLAWGAKDAVRLDKSAARLPVAAHSRTLSWGTSVEKFSPNRFRIHTWVDGPAWLVVREQLYPGWCAYVDGKRVRLESADGIFSAIKLDTGGTTDVDYVFAPTTYLLGFFCSLWALAIFGFAAGWHRAS